MDKTIQALARLAICRKDALELHRRVDDLFKRLTADTEYQKLKSELELAKAMLAQCEEGVRSEALWAESVGKELPKGVQVQNWKKATVIDAEALKKWCLSNFTPALSIDTKKVEKEAKAGNIPAELVEVNEVKKAKIATDLSEYEHLFD